MPIKKQLSWSPRWRMKLRVRMRISLHVGRGYGFVDIHPESQDDGESMDAFRDEVSSATTEPLASMLAESFQSSMTSAPPEHMSMTNDMRARATRAGVMNPMARPATGPPPAGSSSARPSVTQSTPVSQPLADAGNQAILDRMYQAEQDERVTMRPLTFRARRVPFLPPSMRRLSPLAESHTESGTRMSVDRMSTETLVAGTAPAEAGRGVATPRASSAEPDHTSSASRAASVQPDRQLSASRVRSATSGRGRPAATESRPGARSFYDDVGYPVSISDWPYENPELYDEEKEFFGLPDVTEIDSRKMIFNFAADTKEGAWERISYLMTSRRSFWSIYDPAPVSEGAQLREAMRLDARFILPMSAQDQGRFVEHGRQVIEKLGFVNRQACDSSTLRDWKLADLLSQYMTMMQLVTTLVKISDEEDRQRMMAAPYQGRSRGDSQFYDYEESKSREEDGFDHHYHQGFSRRSDPHPVETRSSAGMRQPMRSTEMRHHTEVRRSAEPRLETRQPAEMQRPPAEMRWPTQQNDAMLSSILTREREQDRRLSVGRLATSERPSQRSARMKYGPASSDEEEDDDEGGRSRLTHFVPPESIPKFYGREDQPEEAKQWLKTFYYVIESARWTNQQIIRAFMISMKKSADFWFQRLPKTTKRTWKLIAKAFQQEFCEVRFQSPSARYWGARRRNTESPYEYIYRVSHYARLAGIPIGPGEEGADEHVMHYLNTVDDRTLVDRFLASNISNIDELSARMRRVRISERQRNVTNQVPDTRERADYDRRDPNRRVSFQANSSSLRPYSPRGERRNDRDRTRATRPGNVASANARSSREYYDDDLDYQQEPECDDFESENEYDRDEYACAAQSFNSRVQPWILPICPKCGKGRHREPDCFLNRHCTACKRMGHEADRCFYVCKVCLLSHPIGECSHAKYLMALDKWVSERMKNDDLPAELREMKKHLNI